MKSTPEAIADARASRAELIAAVQNLRRRLSLPELAEDALRAIDPQLTFLGRVKGRIQRNPLLAAALLAGAGWLAGGGSNGHETRHPHRRKMNHENTNNTKGEAS